MGQPAAKQGDSVQATDLHVVMVPIGTGEVPTPLPHPFSGTLQGALAPSVRVGGKPAAVAGSTATNSPAHLPTPPGTRFLTPPTNLATLQQGSTTVRISGKPAARHGDIAMTCNDPADAPLGTVIATGTVSIGG